MRTKQMMRALRLLPAAPFITETGEIQSSIRTNRQRNNHYFCILLFSQVEWIKAGHACSVCSVNDKIPIKANSITLDKLWSFWFRSIFSPFKQNRLHVRSVFSRLKTDFKKVCLKTAFIIPMLSPFTFFILWLWLYFARFIILPMRPPYMKQD